MPIYHLNTYNSIGDAPDEEGGEFPDLAAAREGALMGIRSLLSHEVLKGWMDFRGRVEIVKDGRIVLVIPFLEAVTVRPADR